MLKEKIWVNFQRIIELFTQKVVTKLSKIWVWDPGSEIRDPGSGMGKNQDPGSGINIPDPQQCLRRYLCFISGFLFGESGFGSRIRIQTQVFNDKNLEISYIKK